MLRTVPELGPKTSRKLQAKRTPPSPNTATRAATTALWISRSIASARNREPSPARSYCRSICSGVRRSYASSIMVQSLAEVGQITTRPHIQESARMRLSYLLRPTHSSILDAASVYGFTNRCHQQRRALGCVMSSVDELILTRQERWEALHVL